MKRPFAGPIAGASAVVLLVSALLASSTGVASGQTVSLTIDATAQGAVISPLLFGHNLEHTRQAIWQGIGAEMVANRKFAAIDGGLPKRWWTLKGRGVSVSTQVTYAGKHSVRLDNATGTPCGLWQQHEWLAFRKGTKYAFRIWTKAETNQTLRLQIIDRPGFHTVFLGETVAKSGDWQLWSGEFVSPVPVRDGRLQIQLVTPGPLWIGAISLMPADNFHGLRRDVVGWFKQLKPGCLRWPGGCFAEYYNWKDGLLPVDQRPPIGPGQWLGQFTDTDGYDNHEIGTDEFLALCRELNCAPAITVRYGEGSPAEAADWVQYCNGGPQTPWGKIRAQRGQPEPYGVKYWFDGNEISGMSLVKNKDPKVCTELSRRFDDAMLKADPGIIPIRCVPLLAPEWQSLLLKEMAESPEIPLLIQDGNYAPEYSGMGQVVKMPTQELWSRLQAQRQVLDRANPGRKRVGLVYYEWNVMWDRPGDVISGVFAAGMLNMFCREATPLDLVFTCYFQPVNEGAIKVGPLTSELEADGHVFVLYGAHQGNRWLKTPALAADADMDLCASRTPDGQGLFATVLNRSTTSERTLELSLRGFTGPAQASVKLLIPLTLEVGGKFVQRDEELKIEEGNRVTLKLPPCSIAGVRFGTADGVVPLPK